MNCTNCGHERTTGNFCGRCGAQFSEQTLENQDIIIKKIEPNPHIENIKDKMKLYFSYFIKYLKNPSDIYKKDDNEFLNGIISIILLATLIGLAFFTLSTNNTHIVYNSGFLSIFGSLFIFSVTSTGLVLLTLLLINNFFGPQHSFKSIISLYGGHLSPIILLGITSLLLLFFKSFTFGGITLIIVFLFSVFILPLYLISFLLTKKSSSADPFYGFIIYIVTFSISLSILTIILADSTISKYLNKFIYFIWISLILYTSQFHNRTISFKNRTRSISVRGGRFLLTSIEPNKESIVMARLSLSWKRPLSRVSASC